MKQNTKRILSVALVLCMALSVFCSTPMTAQAAAYTKTIKKTVTLKGYQAKLLKFKVKSDATLTINAKVKSDSDSNQYRYTTMYCEGTMYSAYFTEEKKLSQNKEKFEKGTQNLIITSAGDGSITLEIEIKAKKPVLKFVSLKKTHVRTGSSSDDEK